MNILRQIVYKNGSFKTLFRERLQSYSGLYEPSYLESMKSKVPLYDRINIQIRGYDYSIVESYQKLLHNTLTNMDVNVEDSWAVPAQHMKISTYKTNSEIVNATYSLKIYERTIQVADVPSTQLPIIIRVIEACQPAGATVNIRPHEVSDEENRYIPDVELGTLKQELEELGGPSKKKS